MNHKTSWLQQLFALTIYVFSYRLFNFQMNDQCFTIFEFPIATIQPTFL